MGQLLAFYLARKDATLPCTVVPCRDLLRIMSNMPRLNGTGEAVVQAAKPLCCANVSLYQACGAQRATREARTPARDQIASAPSLRMGTALTQTESPMPPPSGRNGDPYCVATALSRGDRAALASGEHDDNADDHQATNCRGLGHRQPCLARWAVTQSGELCSVLPRREPTNYSYLPVADESQIDAKAPSHRYSRGKPGASQA